MTAHEFFSNRPEPTLLEPDPKSGDDYDREAMRQFCYDLEVDDEDMDEVVEALLGWRNRRADLYAQALKAKIELLEACREYDASGENRPEGYILPNHFTGKRQSGE